MLFQGHIKLSDFGLCTGLKKAHRTDFYRNITPANVDALCKLKFMMNRICTDLVKSSNFHLRKDRNSLF